MSRNAADQKTVRKIQQELIESVVPGGIMGGYLEEGFPFYYINEQMLLYLGYEDQEDFVADIAGMITNCIHPDDRHRVDQECDVQLPQKGSYEIQYRMKKKDGSYIWVHDTGKKFNTEDGREAIISICYDITEEKEQGEFLQKFVDSMNGSMGTYIVNEDGSLIPVFLSSGLGRMIGMSKQDYVDVCRMDAMDCIHPDDRKKLVSAVLRTIKDKKANVITFRSLTKNGTYTWLNGSYSRSADIDGRPSIRVIFTPASVQFEMQQDILHNIPGGICLYKWDGDELLALIISDQFVKLYGGAIDEDSEKISAIDFEYVHPEDLAAYQDFIKEIIQNPGKERFHTFRFWNQKKDCYAWIGVNTTDVKQPDGTLLIYASYSNVDEIKEAEEQLKARIRMEQERLVGGDGNLLAYVVSNISRDSIVEHKTFAGEIPLAKEGERLEDGAKESAGTIIDPEKQSEFLDCHDCKKLMNMYTSGINSMSLEFRRRRTNGTIGWERNVLNILREPESDDLFLYEYCYDINKEKLLEETMIAAVNYSYERVASINILADQISMLLPDPQSEDYRLEIKKYSKLCREYAQKNVVKEDRQEFLQNVLPENLEKKLEATGAFEFNHRETGVDGTIRYKQDRHAYYDREKKICLITRSDVTQMVTEEEEKQKKLQVALEREKEAAKIKSDFLSRMSHELRTPLNVISGYSTLLEQNIRNGSGKKEDLEYLDSLQNATKYLLAIIGDILNFQKMGSGKVKLLKEKINMDEYMNHIIHMIRPEADQKQIDFSYKRTMQFHECYLLDGVRLEQILLNILHNAVKFTPNGGNVTIDAQASSQEGKETLLQFTIADTGIGMSPAFMEQGLFQPFSQENHGITSPYEGTGIGLIISRELSRLMGGDITCTSEKGKGTVFHITIQAEPYRENTEPRKRRARQSISYDLNGARILICEDNPSNQDMTKRLLERMKCIVEVADDGAIGVDKFNNSAPGFFDLILMDLRMPVMDGFEATRAIRSQKREDAGKIPILALSANALEEDVQMSLDSGMNEHMAKPIDARILYEKIKWYCGK